MKRVTASKLIANEIYQRQLEVVPAEYLANMLEAADILNKKELLQMLEDYINDGLIK